MLLQWSHKPIIFVYKSQLVARLVTTQWKQSSKDHVMTILFPRSCKSNLAHFCYQLNHFIISLLNLSKWMNNFNQSRNSIPLIVRGVNSYQWVTVGCVKDGSCQNIFYWNTIHTFCHVNFQDSNATRESTGQPAWPGLVPILICAIVNLVVNKFGC